MPLPAEFTFDRRVDQTVAYDLNLLLQAISALPPAGITALTGDGTATGPGSVALTLATVNANVGSFTNANITVNGKGLITAAASGSSAGITALTGDVTATGPGSVAATLATVNANVGSFTSANITVNGKGLITAAANGPAAGITDLTGDVTATGPGSAAATLATVNANVGTFSYPTMTVDGKGRITSISSNSVTSGTVTSVSVVTANGVSGTVANATTTPAITLALGAITPSSVNGNTITTGTGTLTLGSNTLTAAGTASVSGTNTGDQTISLTSDVTGSGTGSITTTLATVNSNVGSFTNANITVNGKGLITAAANGTAISAGSAVGLILVFGG